MTRTALRHLSLLVMSLGLLAVGSALIVRADDDIVRTVGAQAGERLQIAPGTSFEWTNTIGPVWIIENGAPGNRLTGSLRLRTAELADAGDATFRISAETSDTAGNAPLADYLLIEEMRLSSIGLLEFWGESCRPNGKMTLATLISCDSPALPRPAAGEGLVFTMTFVIDPSAGNAIQGLRADHISVLFTLVGQTEVPGPDPANGSITVNHVSDPRIDPANFTLSAGSQSGPGPRLTASAASIDTDTIVRVTGPGTFDLNGAEYNVRLAGVTCASDVRGLLDVPVNWTVTVTLVHEGEAIECTFESLLEAIDGTPADPALTTPTPATDGASGPTSTPYPPASGTGGMPTASLGTGMVVVGISLFVLWASSTLLAAATFRRRRSR